MKPWGDFPCQQQSQNRQNTAPNPHISRPGSVVMVLGACTRWQSQARAVTRAEMVLPRPSDTPQHNNRFLHPVSCMCARSQALCTESQMRI